ncbi:helix-turn-helix transcriptional regulator [Mucilaginibacter sp.]|uniref:helix-turn-helix transcriptional regulator n=1 Tax=Mucilaginibacter sp. TaxID=1882438 RepID=UPI003263FE89
MRRLVSYRKVLKKPNIPQYAATPCTLGEHIRKARIERGLLQREISALLKVSEDSVTGWENGRSEPQVKHYPRILEFLRYYPFVHETESLAGKLRQIRFCRGLSVKQCARRLAVSEAAVQRWECDTVISNPAYRRLIHSEWTKLPPQFMQHPL